MNRRQFLQTLSAAVAAIAAPQAALAKPSAPLFDPSIEYGNAMSYVVGAGRRARLDMKQWLCDVLIADARKHIPPGERIWIMENEPMDFGRLRGVAWLYTPPDRKLGNRDRYVIGSVIL